MPVDLTVMQIITYLSLSYNKKQRTIIYLNKYLVNICILKCKFLKLSVLALTTSSTKSQRLYMFCLLAVFVSTLYLTKYNKLK